MILLVFVKVNNRIYIEVVFY